MIDIRGLREEIDGMYAEPQSEEGQEVIHDDDTHVAEVWEDGEITVTKSGDLYGHRNIHQSEKPFLPEKQTLFDVPPEKDHKRMVIVDNELKNILAEYRTLLVDRKLIDIVMDTACPECGGMEYEMTPYGAYRCTECDIRHDASELLESKL